MKPVIINITKNDIKYGKRFNHCFCPVARAIKRTVKTTEVEVHTLECIVKRKKYILPHAVTNFIQGFDFGLPVAPFRFALDIKRTFKDNAGIK